MMPRAFTAVFRKPACGIRYGSDKRRLKNYFSFLLRLRIIINDKKNNAKAPSSNNIKCKPLFSQRDVRSPYNALVSLPRFVGPFPLIIDSTVSWRDVKNPGGFFLPVPGLCGRSLEGAELIEESILIGFPSSSWKWYSSYDSPH